MITARLATSVVAPRRLKTAVQLLPAAMLFTSLVLGGPSFTGDLSTGLMVPNDGGQHCPGQVNEKGDCIITGSNSGN